MTSTQWTPDPELAREVDDLYERAIQSYRANPNLITEHANHEESIRVGGYSNRTLLELVQNAADAMTGAEEYGAGSGRVEIVLDLESRTLYCANAGRPFSRNGLITLAHAHLSGKRGDEIGRFGLGFKSVLAVTNSPQVFSRSVAFEFNSPEAIESISAIAPGTRRLPILRTMRSIDADAAFETDPILAELATWASTIVRLPDLSRADTLKGEIENFRSEFLLFVDSVREVRLRVSGSDKNYETRHVSQSLGGGRFRISSPNGDNDEWLVENRMHAPTREARAEVGEAVSRDQVKVTVALPARSAQMRLGEFWSYFPLQDRTSASALFNAPWSLNDDRTTLLRNTYNREILVNLSAIFAEILPKAAMSTDPAAHLDLMPARSARGEEYSFGDEIIRAQVPRHGSSNALIPDASGVLRRASELRPLDFTIDGVGERDHREWIASPHTSDDVPHWRCYSTTQRARRVREIYMNVYSPVVLDRATRDDKAALEKMPKRGILTWLKEWADGPDPESAARAFFFVTERRQLRELESAKVIPTTGGLRSMSDRNSVFLESNEDLGIEGACFVLPEFLALSGVEAKLKDAGFGNLDATSILRARLAQLHSGSDDESHARLWDAALDVPPSQAVQVMSQFAEHHIKVPTCDGGWAPPTLVLDIAGIGEGAPERRLDHPRCVPTVAHALGVVRAPIGEYSIEDESAFPEYLRYALDYLNERSGIGDRRIERLEFVRNEGPGPFSALFMLQESDAPESIRAKWTCDLLQLDCAEWECEDIDTERMHSVPAPVRWAVEQAGLVDSTRGHRRPQETVSPSLLEFAAFLPLFKGPRAAEEAIGLPRRLADVPIPVLREAFTLDPAPVRVEDAMLTRFVIEAGCLAYTGEERPPLIPAKVGQAIELKRPDTVYVAVNEEQRALLASRHKAYLSADPVQAVTLLEVIGCRSFEESFTFSMQIDGAQGPQRVTELYTGLRLHLVYEKIANASVVKALQITKRVSTDEGVENQPLDWHLDGLTLTVRAEYDEPKILEIINRAFGLGMNNFEQRKVLQDGLDLHMEQQREAARAVADDAERLEVFFGEDTLREKLPKGLWQALEAQGLVDARTSVSELFLKVYGSESIKELAAQFREEGYSNVPTEWAGRPKTIAWLREMGFGAHFAGPRTQTQEAEFVVPGAVELNPLHSFQRRIAKELRNVLQVRDSNGRHRKVMVELPTGAGKTRVASQTVLQLFTDDYLEGPVLWIAQSAELCEQAVQTFVTVWQGLADKRPLTIGRLWEGNTVNEPDTEFSVIVATDAMLEQVIKKADYEWLSRASAVFVDEAHRTGGSKRYTAILKWLGVDGHGWDRPLVGLTATPFKGTVDDGAATKELAARFGRTIIRAFDGDAYEELAKLEVLARVERTVLPGIKVDLNPEELRQATSMRRLEAGVLERIGRDQGRMRALVDHILEQDPTWPILVFTPNVLSAQVLAAILRYRDVDAQAVSGQTGRQERRDIIERFRNREIRVLTNCDLLVQGFDAPGVRALYIARPTMSPSAYIQMVGRGLRGPLNGGEKECLIVDVEDNFGAANDFLGYKAYERFWGEHGS